MSKTRPWMLGLGGVFLFLALYGLFFVDEMSRYRGLLSYLPSFIVYLVTKWFLSLLIGLLLVYLGNGATPVGRWLRLIEGLSASPSQLYKQVEQRLAELDVPDYQVSKATFCQGGLVSTKRIQLQVTRGYFRFDLYAAPFGASFGAAWRCYVKIPFAACAVCSIPVLGWAAYVLFFRYTAYIEDRGLMFQETMQSCVRQSIDALTEEHGVRALSDDEHKPIMADMYCNWR